MIVLSTIEVFYVTFCNDLFYHDIARQVVVKLKNPTHKEKSFAIGHKVVVVPLLATRSTIPQPSVPSIKTGKSLLSAEESETLALLVMKKLTYDFVSLLVFVFFKYLLLYFKKIHSDK